MYAIHNYSPTARNLSEFFLLNFIPLIVFLKDGEHLGIYIDASNPNLFFKLETNSSGQFRAMLLPQDFESDSLKISGQCRVNKYSLGNPDPYISLIELTDQDVSEICSKVLKLSYQTEAKVIVDSVKKIALLVCKIPKLKSEKFESKEDLSLDAYLAKRKTFLAGMPPEITKINTRKIQFACNCSREQFLPSLKKIYQLDGDALFKEPLITITCDYCKSIYSFSRQDLASFELH